MSDEYYCVEVVIYYACGQPSVYNAQGGGGAACFLASLACRRESGRSRFAASLQRPPARPGLVRLGLANCSLRRGRYARRTRGPGEGGAWKRPRIYGGEDE